SDDSSTIFYQAREADRAHPNIWATDLDGRTRAVTHFHSPHLRLFESFTLSSGRLYFPVREERADLWLADVEWR
ncbi:MAG: hypothetical protein MI919_19900, partial [Holophagales bacterium]|nr:hypothetical protein [Holophagales bacterium]